MYYWKQEDEDNVIAWQQRKSKLDELISYKKLNTKIMFIVETIGNKYFTFSFEEKSWLYGETRNHVFLRLDKFLPSNGTAFSFISVAVKNYFYNYLKNKYFKYVDKNYIISETDLIYSIEDDDEEDIYMKLINYLESKVNDLEQKLIDKRLTQKVFKENKVINNKIVIGRLILKYFTEYGIHNYSVMNLIDYVNSNANLKNYTVISGINYFVNQTTIPQSYNDYGKFEKNWIEKLGLFNTDVCPNTSNERKFRMFKKMEEGYVIKAF